MERFSIDESIFEDELWMDLTAFRLWLFLIGRAVSLNPVNYGGIVLQPGQYLRSYRGLQEELSYLEHGAIKTYSLAGIKRAVDRLVLERRISIEESKFGTVFTILNYESYQVFSGRPHPEIEIGKQSEKSVRNLSNKQGANIQQALCLDLPIENTISDGKLSGGTDSIWGDGLKLLLNAGIKEPNVRAFLGRALKQYGEEALNEAISAALLNDPADPRSYLMGCLKKQKEEKDGATRERQYMTPGERRTQELLERFTGMPECGN